MNENKQKRGRTLCPYFKNNERWKGKANDDADDDDDVDGSYYNRKIIAQSWTINANINQDERR